MRLAITWPNGCLTESNQRTATEYPLHCFNLKEKVKLQNDLEYILFVVACVVAGNM